MHIDSLARNAFFEHPYPLYGLSSATGFSGLTADDKMNTDLLDTIWLGMRDRTKPFSALPVHAPTGNEIVCITTAGAVHDLKRENNDVNLNFIEATKYTRPGDIIRGELGMWRGVRFVDNGFAKLWNVGAITHQSKISAALKPGDGAPDPTTTKVEQTRRVGQPSATHYVQVADASGFLPNTMITIHSYRLASDDAEVLAGRGVTNGVDFKDPMLQNVEIHSVDTDNNRLYLKEPYLMSDQDGKGLETDQGSSTFGWVTYGVTVHTALFLVPGMENNGIINGVAQQPVIYTPPAIDDYLSIYRVSYDFWMKFALWEARNFELFFFRGANRLLGGIFR